MNEEEKRLAEESGENCGAAHCADVEKMTAEQQLLTHFLGCIADRRALRGSGSPQMEPIFSQLVRDFKDHSAYYLLLHPGPYFDRIKVSPNDLVGIFCTLKVLAHFTEKSFAAYLQKCLALAPSGHEPEFLLYGLWLLGYSDIGEWEEGKPEYQAIYERSLVKKYAAIERFWSGGEIPEQPFGNKQPARFVRDWLEHRRS